MKSAIIWTNIVIMLFVYLLMHNIEPYNALHILEGFMFSAAQVILNLIFGFIAQKERKIGFFASAGIILLLSFPVCFAAFWK